MALATALILEDSYDRIRVLSGSLKRMGHVPCVCETAEEAIAKLANPVTSVNIKTLFLDHDLGDHKPGMVLVDWLVKEGREYDNIYIHSMNFVSAKEMGTRLSSVSKNVQLIPYNALKPLLEEMAAQCRDAVSFEDRQEIADE